MMQTVTDDVGCRGQIHLTCIEAMGLAIAFRHTVNGRSYLEVHHRVSGSTALQILSIKANHPDDAALWLRDMQAGQKVSTMYFTIKVHL